MDYWSKMNHGNWSDMATFKDRCVRDGQSQGINSFDQLQKDFMQQILQMNFPTRLVFGNHSIEVLLPQVMEFNIPAADLHAMALRGILKIREIMKACKVPANLRSMGVTQTDIPILAQEAMKIQRLLKNNPRTVLLEDAINIYEKTF